jgi:hypothetical protein
MKLWQLCVAMVCGRVHRVEVLALRCSGYHVRAVMCDGAVSTVQFAAGRSMWPAMPVVKSRLLRCGVRKVLLLQPESHDEIIGRPVLLTADPGLWMPLR